MSFTKKALTLAVTLALPAIMFSQNMAHAHGYISNPLTRNLMCKNQGGFWSGNPPTAGCQAYKDSNGWQTPLTDPGGSTGSGWLDYQSSIPDGKICSVNYPALNTLVKNGDWPTSQIKPKSDGSIDLAYKYTAYHGTDHVAFYITKHEFNPAQTLKWSDLELLGRRDGANSPDGNNETHFNFKLPAQQNGRHVIVAAWPVSGNHGTREVFMSCADVTIEDSGVATPSWETIGEGLNASAPVDAQTVVRFRLYNKAQKGAVAFETEFTAGQNMQAKDWLHQLANKINAGTNLVKVGVLNGGTVAADKPSAYYGVYSKGNEYEYAVYLEKPAGGDEGTVGEPSVNAGQDMTVTESTDSSRAYELNATVQNAVSYQWTIVSGQKKFYLQEKQSAPWVDTVNALKARALVPAKITGEAIYRLTVKNKDGKVATDDVKVTVKAAAQQGAPVAVITTGSMEDTIIGWTSLAVGANQSYFPDGSPINKAHFEWSLVGANADKVNLSSTNNVSLIMMLKPGVTSNFDATLQLKVTDPESGKFGTVTKVFKFRSAD